MKIATLHVHDRHIEVSSEALYDDDYFNVFYMPLSSLSGNETHHYSSIYDEQLIKDYNQYLELQEGVYYAFSNDQLPIDLADLPAQIDAIYNEGTFYFSGIYSKERFNFLYGYLMASMLDYDQMANGICAAFYVVFSHMVIAGAGAS